jgi:formylglycine-generating enzyme required for sulfatase activity
MKLDEHGVHAVLATHPVTRGEYKEYLRVNGLAIPPSLARIAPPSVPVTDVSRVDAVAYCEWLGRREGRPYRLPTIAELLGCEAEEDGSATKCVRTSAAQTRKWRNERDVPLRWTYEVEETPAHRPAVAS